ncbi:MAG: flagella synthesis protein FlgN [Candidatus Azotimanducaceae bacterium]|jgi:flagella synthesis protein FlgN
MEANQKSPPDLHDLVNRDLAGYAELLELLNREKQLLVERDFDAFAAVLERKHTLLTELDQQTRQRLARLTALSLTTDDAGMQSLIDQQPEFGRERLSSAWVELKKLVQQCSRQNEVNSKIVARAQTTSRQILNMLKGAPLTKGLYGKSGTTQGVDAGLSITRA